ncbi:nucleoside 2-deoxyribosyltransferase [Acidiphilium sp. PA]|uniref:nucleoside 2-deoxyribosyltransferase n=1 Tax=Acidiphilium sp. PA TaxID=2871705 RepID=UPI0022433EFE|nr:nucleoside 2-deoxyribosyltransferase [Acidiphilium sp. PA]MCW8309488.1 nucleoside 2-deoxyribosyltransferase [Acidiphilium sp. PA]
MIKAYLAGPDVFLPNALEHARRKIEICARHGIVGLAPLNEDAGPADNSVTAVAWSDIFHKDIEMMEASDIIIANLTPFRGASADAGTLVEIGWFLGRGKPIFGYSNSARLFDQRSKDQANAVPDPMRGIAVEGFGLPDNLMIPGAVLQGGGGMIILPDSDQDEPFDALNVFEKCVRLAADKLASWKNIAFGSATCN